MFYLKLLIVGLGSTYALWIFFLAIMSLARARDAKTLTKLAFVLGYPVLIVGYLLDFFVNITVMTVLLLEIPQETTVTSRLSRHLNDVDGYRKAIATIAKQVLDAFDPSGKHLK